MQIYFLRIKPLISYIEVFPMKYSKLGMTVPLAKNFNMKYSYDAAIVEFR